MEQTTVEKAVEVGDVVVDVWGYSMTIVDFYKVIRMTEKSIFVVPIGSKEVGEGGYLSGRVIADTEKVGTEVSCMRKRIGYRGQQVFNGTLKSATGSKLEGHTVMMWNGEPKYYNHCD